jgi:hypothetical protein
LPIIQRKVVESCWDYLLPTAQANVSLATDHKRGIITYLAGASTILPKPFEIDDLINTIACYSSLTQESEPSLPEASRER